MRITNYGLELNGAGQAVLVKESAFNAQDVLLSTPTAVALFFKEYYRLQNKAEELLFVVAVNNKIKPIGIFQVSHGTNDSCFCNPREILIRLLLLGASDFIVVHNHPSRDCTPSEVDCLSTERLINAGRLVGIGLLDHIIVGGNRYFSFSESGFIKKHANDAPQER